MKIITNPGPCSECIHSIEITLVDWKNETIPIYKDGDVSKQGSGHYTITCPGFTTSADLHTQNTILIKNVSPGVAKIKFTGIKEDLIFSAGHIPIPIYDKEDMRLKNGTGPYEPFREELKGEYGRYPVVQERFHIIDLSRKVWELKQKATIAPQEHLVFETDDWISPAEKHARRSGYYYHRISRRDLNYDGEFEFDLIIDANAQDKTTRHVIELVGQYSYIPALEFDDPKYNHVNAYNLSLISLLAYAKREVAEDGSETGSINYVFHEMEEGRRPKRINDHEAALILRLVPYAQRFATESILLLIYNEFHILLVDNMDSVLVGCSGIPLKAYKGDPSEMPSWQSAVDSNGHEIGFKDIYIHRGIDKVFEGLESRVKEFFDEENRTQKKIFIGAHCFGGGVASKLIFNLSRGLKPARPPLFYSFGMPLVLCKTFYSEAFEFASEIIKPDAIDIRDFIFGGLQCRAHHRVVKSGDLLCWLPFMAEAVIEWDKVQKGLTVVVYKATMGKYVSAAWSLFNLFSKPPFIRYQPWGQLTKNVCLDPESEGAFIHPSSYPACYYDVIPFIHDNNAAAHYSNMLYSVFNISKPHHNPRSYSKFLRNDLKAAFYKRLGHSEEYNRRLKLTTKALESIQTKVEIDQSTGANWVVKAIAKENLEPIRADFREALAHNPIFMFSCDGWDVDQELIYHFPLADS